MTVTLTNNKQLAKRERKNEKLPEVIKHMLYAPRLDVDENDT